MTKNFCCFGILKTAPIFTFLYMTTQSLTWKARMRLSVKQFRFEKNDLTALAEASQIPGSFKCKQGAVCDGMTGLCIVSKIFAYPVRYTVT